MVDNRGVFLGYLQQRGLFTQQIEGLFDLYFECLTQQNRLLNLYSRQMPSADIWIKHFLDSVSIVDVFSDFTHKRVLDFGTGGGLPGIPIKLLFPQCEMSFLDSTQKKIASVKCMCEQLGLPGAHFFTHRLESEMMATSEGYFDIIVSRGVKMTPSIYRALQRLLARTGRVLLYKGRDIADTELFCHKKVYNLHIDILGERKIVETIL